MKYENPGVNDYSAKTAASKNYSIGDLIRDTVLIGSFLAIGYSAYAKPIVKDVNSELVNGKYHITATVQKDKFNINDARIYDITSQKTIGTVLSGKDIIAKNGKVEFYIDEKDISQNKNIALIATDKDPKDPKNTYKINLSQLKSTATQIPTRVAKASPTATATAVPVTGTAIADSNTNTYTAEKITVTPTFTPTVVQKTETKKPLFSFEKFISEEDIGVGYSYGENNSDITLTDGSNGSSKSTISGSNLFANGRGIAALKIADFPLDIIVAGSYANAPGQNVKTETNGSTENSKIDLQLWDVKGGFGTRINNVLRIYALGGYNDQSVSTTDNNGQSKMNIGGILFETGVDFIDEKGRKIGRVCHIYEKRDGKIKTVVMPYDIPYSEFSNTFRGEWETPIKNLEATVSLNNTNGNNSNTTTYSLGLNYYILGWVNLGFTGAKTVGTGVMGAKTDGWTIGGQINFHNPVDITGILNNPNTQQSTPTPTQTPKPTETPIVGGDEIKLPYSK